MGNEMGNNNSSGLQEEENTNTNTGDRGRSSQEAGHGDGSEVENHIVPVGESKDCHDKETGLDSDAPKAEAESHFFNQIIDETEVHNPAGSDSAEVEVKSNDEVGDGTIEIQPLQSSLERNPSQLNDLNLQKQQTSIAKDDEEMNYSAFDTKSSSHDPELQELVDSKSDQPDKLDEIQADPSVQDSTGTPLEAEDILGSNLTCTSEENGHLIDDNMLKNMGESSVSVSGVTQEMASIEEEMSCEERLETKGDEIGNDLEIKCNGDLPEAESAAIKSLNSHLEVSAETMSLGKESEHGENRPDSCPAQTCEESVKGSAELLMIQSECENSNGKRAADYASSDSGSDTDYIEEAKAAENGHLSLGKESEHGENRLDSCPAQSCEESVKGSAELVMIQSECENSNNKRATDYASSDSGSDTDCIEEAKAAENGHLSLGKESEHGENRPDSCPAQSCEESVKGSAELVMIQSECENSNDKRATDYASSDSGSDTDCIEEAKASENGHLSLGKESDHGENRPGSCPAQSCEESVKGSAELMMIQSECENSNDKRATDYASSDSESDTDCIEEAKAAENGHLIDVHLNNNEASMEQHKDSTKEAVMVPESGAFLIELSLQDCKIEEALKEQKIVEEIQEKNEAFLFKSSHSNMEREFEKIKSSGESSMEQHKDSTKEAVMVPESGAFLIESSLQDCKIEEALKEQKIVEEIQEKNEAFLPKSSHSNMERESEKIKSSNESISELKQESCGELLVTEVSSLDSINLMAETSLSAVTVAESNPPAKDHETPASASESYQAEENVGRESTESNPNNSNIQAQMQKSPSFGLDLRIEARSEESDRTPSLYQEKTAIEDFSAQAYISLGSSTEYQAMPVEERVVLMERSDSEKPKTPFLGFLKEEEEARVSITPQKQDDREKRKPRSSLFTNCMCCTAVIN